MFHIYFTDNHLSLERETLAASYQAAIFENQSVPCKHHIRSRLTEPTRTENITGNATSRLLADQRTQIVVLTNPFIIRRQIKQNFRTLQCQ